MGRETPSGLCPVAKKPIIKNDKASVADTANAYIQNGIGRVYITPNECASAQPHPAAKSISKMTIRVICVIAVSSDGATADRLPVCARHATGRDDAVAAH